MSSKEGLLMVTLIGLLRTFTVAAQPLDCLPYQDRKTIRFRNGLKLNLTFPQFRDVRDSYTSLKKYEIKQLGPDLFEVNFGEFKTTANMHMICVIADLSHRYHVNKLEDDLFRIQGSTFVLEGTSTLLGVFRELFFGEYKTNFKGKVVLDIGGFQGESAVYFWLLGAKKIVIYEPASKYFQFVKKNVEMNHIDAEIHQSGIGNVNGTLLIDVFSPNPPGVNHVPEKELIKITNITEAISRSGADVAKLDCEGAEMSLITVPNEILRKIPLYMLELHGEDVREAVTSKFLSAGFRVRKIENLGNGLSIVHFRT